jgi:hypothetical protein
LTENWLAYGNCCRGRNRFVPCCGVFKALKAAKIKVRSFKHETKGFKMSNVETGKCKAQHNWAFSDFFADSLQEAA